MMSKNFSVALLGLSLLSVHAQAADRSSCVEIPSTKVHSVEAYISPEFTLAASGCKIHLYDDREHLAYEFIADGKTVTHLPRGFLSLHNERLSRYGIQLVDAAYIATFSNDKSINRYYTGLDLIGSAIVVAKIVVPVAIEFEIKAESRAYAWSNGPAGASLSIDEVKVKRIKGLPSGVSKYVAKAIDLVLKVLKGPLKFELAQNN